MKTLLYAQSGGPTAVINASASGVIYQAQQFGYDKILCANFGMQGLLNEDFWDVTNLTQKQLQLLQITPASAFGSCRLHLPTVDSGDEIYHKIEQIFKKYDIRTFIYNGGNDSMDTCNKINKYFAQSNFDCCVIGVPKTIDNDLLDTHFCPGYGSACKYVANTIQNVALDTSAYTIGRVTVCEIMGREAGWITASCALASNGYGADIICVPEYQFDLDSLLNKISQIFNQKGHCLVAVAEGISLPNRNSLMEDNDGFGHKKLDGIATQLTSVVQQRLKLPTRAIELSIPQRASQQMLSAYDLQCAYDCGMHAVTLANEKLTGVMVTVTPQYPSEPLGYTQIDNVANKVKLMPSNFFTQFGITQDYVNYARPLIMGEVPLSYTNGISNCFDVKVLQKYKK